MTLIKREIFSKLKSHLKQKEITLLTGPRQSGKTTLLSKNYEITYWRSKDGAEVDMVLKAGNDIVPIEVKFQDLHNDSIAKSLYNFIKRYAPQKAYIVNKSRESSRTVNGTEVRFLPYYRLIEEINN